jgi:PHP family Zn ribbon phosphoesterase
MLKWIKADLHIHTVLSACAELNMSPRDIIAQAAAMHIGLLAITDHHALDNVIACQEAARGTGITVLYGMEVQTREEVHLICLLPDAKRATSFASFIDSHLPASQLEADSGSLQAVVTADDRVVRLDQRNLLASLDLSVEDVCQRVQQHEGLVIAAHIDRPHFSLLGNLGFIPPGLQVAALETTTEPALLYAQHRSTVGYPIIVSSDAHCLAMLEKDKYTYFYISEEVTLSEISRALKGESGRKFKIDR